MDPDRIGTEADTAETQRFESKYIDWRADTEFYRREMVDFDHIYVFLIALDQLPMRQL
jgi:hypothetical protein